MPRDAPLPIRDAVDQADVEESLLYLMETAEEAAHAIALVEEAEDNLRRARATAAVTSTARSNDMREAEAWTSRVVERAIEAKKQAIARKMTLLHMRRWHELRVEVWRTLQANHRQGAKI